MATRESEGRIAYVRKFQSNTEVYPPNFKLQTFLCELEINYSADLQCKRCYKLRGKQTALEDLCLSVTEYDFDIR